MRFGLKEAQHLLRRAAARGRREEAEALAVGGLAAAIEALLADPAPLGPPSFSEKHRVRPLVEAWLTGWLSTPTPAAERLVLFWHGHFTSEIKKVKRSRLMWRQNETFRRLGYGRFKDLLFAIARDPAMLIYLDNVRSKMPHPNENWARELMELFTLGVGHYTEADVKAAAQAFAGWSVTRPKEGEIRFIFRERWADRSEKDFLGRKVRTGEEVLEHLAEHPQTYRFLSQKLLRYYLHPEPEPALIEAGAKVLKAGTTRDFLAWLFGHEAFFSERARLALIKSPVEYVIGLSYAANAELDQRVYPALAAMGQIPFQPPNVKGWEGHLSWLGTGALLTRINLAARAAAARPDLTVFMDGKHPEDLMRPEAQLL